MTHFRGYVRHNLTRCGKVLNRLHRRNRGEILVLALIFLAVGALVVPPELSLAISSQNLVKIKSEQLEMSYAANAGIEYAMSILSNPNGTYSGSYNINGQGTNPSLVDGMAVVVTIGTASLTFPGNNSCYTYPISAQATDPGNGKSHTLQAQAIQVQTPIGNPPYYTVARQ